MPIYEFGCRACGHTMEVFQKISDPPPAECPECGSTEIGKLVSKTSFQLKGGGWYAQGYSGGSGGGAGGDSGGSGGGGAGGGDSGGGGSSGGGDSGGGGDSSGGGSSKGGSSDSAA